MCKKKTKSDVSFDIQNIIKIVENILGYEETAGTETNEGPMNYAV